MEVLNYSVKENVPALDIIKLKVNKSKQALIQNINQNIQANNIALFDLENQIARLTSEIQKLPVTERQLLNMARFFDLNDSA